MEIILTPKEIACAIITCVWGAVVVFGYIMAIRRK